MNLNDCLVTLDDLVDVAAIDPCLFMGVQPNGVSCPAFDCQKRNMWVSAFDAAVSDMDAALDALGSSLCDEDRVITSRTPTFFHCQSEELVTRKRVRVLSTVAPVNSQSAGCYDDFSVTIPSMQLQPNERIVSARVIFTSHCRCKRLPVRWCQSEFGQTGNVAPFTLVAKGYNFIDIDAIDAGVPTGGAIPMLSSVEIEVIIERPSTARVVWPALSGDCTCPTPSAPNPDPGAPAQLVCPRNQSSEVCIVHTGPTSCTAIDWQCTRGCRSCLVSPVMFETDVVKRGVWRTSWTRAALGLANSRLPQAACGECHPMTTTLYEQDTVPRDNVPIFIYRNGFGIYTPGARLAWETIMQETSETQVLSM